MAAATAQDHAPVLAERRLITRPALRPKRAERVVRRAVIRRLFRVHQIDALRRLDGRPLRHEALTVVARDHLNRPIEALLQPIAHLVKGGHLPRARLQRARAGQAVALAVLPHVVLDRLQENRKRVEERCRPVKTLLTSLPAM